MNCKGALFALLVASCIAYRPTSVSALMVCYEDAPFACRVCVPTGYPPTEYHCSVLCVPSVEACENQCLPGSFGTSDWRCTFLGRRPTVPRPKRPSEPGPFFGGQFSSERGLSEALQPGDEELAETDFGHD